MSAKDWVDAAQVVSGFAALAAVMLAMATAKAGRRTPLTDAYMGAWQSILDTVAVATESREEPPPDESVDLLMRQFNSADHRLSVIEATIRVRLYGRDIRHDLKNLLLDVLYDNHDIRDPGGLTLTDFPRPEWAGCSDEEWVRVVNSVPFASMLVSQVWSLPGRTDDSDGLMRWYYPTVLQGLGAHDSVTASDAPPQRQLAFMLGAYVDAFLLPWIRDATREALLGRIGLRGRLSLWRQFRHRWRHASPWGRHRVKHDGLTLFSSTNERG